MVKRTLPSAEFSQFEKDLPRQKVLAVCEHFSFKPLISFDCLNISNRTETHVYFDRYFARYVNSRPFEGNLWDESFDLIICDNSYHRFQNFAALADEIYRLLKTGGFCYLSGYSLFSLDRTERTSKDKFYRTKKRLKKGLSNFWIHDYTPLIKESPGTFNRGSAGLLRKKGLVARLSKRFFSSFYNEFVWVLTKKK
ncbi:MAG: methyltransferase domain-containing protein [candidate division Zixibacteria bacterium]|nr:methyltransferase domain-containing protein [candidate division Zixibacteria bacterium]